MMNVRIVAIGFTLATIAAFSLGTTRMASAATDPQTCLLQASQQRVSAMRQAYSDYNSQMSRAIDDFGKAESDAINYTNSYLGQSDIGRAYSNYNYAVQQNWQTLNNKLNQAWTTYQTARNGCGNVGYAIPTYQYGTPLYGAAPTYPQYSYPTYQYQYPYAYGYGYGYNYQNSGYPYPYGFGPQTACIQQPLAALPSGCYYECQNNANGCPRCTAKCNSNVTTNDCGCSSGYAPVCTTDRRTYDNACIAACKGRTVWYTGVCY